MNEIARFQRLSSVSSGCLRLPRRRRAAVRVDRAPGEPVERRLVREPRARRARAGPAGRRSRRPGTRRRPPRRARAPRCGRARARVASAGGRCRARWPSSTAADAGRPRSGRRRSRGSAVRLRLERVEKPLELLARVRPSRRRGRTTEAPAARAVGYGTPVPTAPLVSVLVAVSNGERYLRAALESILAPDGLRPRAARRRRRLDRRDAGILAAIDDPRLRVLRNEERLGLAASLNRGLDEAARPLRRPARRGRRRPSAPARAPARSASVVEPAVARRRKRGRSSIDDAGRPGRFT